MPVVTLAEAAWAQLRAARAAACRRCPHCRADRVIRWGQARGRQRFRCRACRRTFTEFTGTPLAYVHHPERAVAVLRHLRLGLTLRRSAARLGIHVATAFRWRHRLIGRLRALPQGVPGEVVELGVLVLPRSEKGSRQLTRAPWRRGRQWPTPGESVRVLLASDARRRLAWLQTEHIPIHRAYAAVVEELLGRVDPWAVVCTEVPEPFGKVCERLGLLDLRRLLAGRGPLALLEVAERATRLRRALRAWLRAFRGVATRYLEAYVAWYGWLRGMHPRRARRRGGVLAWLLLPQRALAELAAAAAHAAAGLAAGTTLLSTLPTRFANSA